MLGLAFLFFIGGVIGTFVSTIAIIEDIDEMSWKEFIFAIILWLLFFIPTSLLGYKLWGLLPT